jgi:hypothetical protein
MAKELQELNNKAEQHAKQCKIQQPEIPLKESCPPQQNFADLVSERTPFDMLESHPSNAHTAEHDQKTAKESADPAENSQQLKVPRFMVEPLQEPPIVPAKVTTADQGVQVNTLQESLQNISPQVANGPTKFLCSKDSKSGSQNFVKLPEEIPSLGDMDKVNETMITAKFANSSSMFVGINNGPPSPILYQQDHLIHRRDAHLLSLERNLNDSSALFLGVPLQKTPIRKTSMDMSQDLADMTLAASSPIMNSSMSRL